MGKHPPIRVTTIQDLIELPDHCYMYYQWELVPAIAEHKESGYLVEEVYMFRHETMGYPSYFIEFEEVEDK